MTSDKPSDFDSVAHILDDAVRTRAFPAVSAEVGRTGGPLWSFQAGRLSEAALAPPANTETVFDLASLTKPIATTSLLLLAIAHGQVALDTRIGRYLPQWRGADRDAVTLADLLAHASGLTAHLPLYRDGAGRADFEQVICTLPLEYVPRSRAIYSDLGFLLLGFILEDLQQRSLDQQFAALRDRWELGEIQYRPDPDWRARTAPTGLDAWRGRVLVGEVHDRNAWVLGGVAGHAGLFGTAKAVGALARRWLEGWRAQPSRTSVPHVLARLFSARGDVPGSSRALGWDTMLPTSSCGTLMNTEAFGHTGFTGTSLWIDPRRDLYAVLLTNRVHPTDQNQAILRVRPAFHDAVINVVDALG